MSTDVEGLLNSSQESVRPAEASRNSENTAYIRMHQWRFLGFVLSLGVLMLVAWVRNTFWPHAAHHGLRGDGPNDLAAETAELLAVTTTETTTPVTRDMATFYMYRAQNEHNYEFENVNAANLAGLLWYLEHEVVFAECPRHYNITRILRYKVSVKTPEKFQHNFSRFWAFDKGMCTSPQCADEYAEHGFTVGCQYQDASSYPGAVWYSLPGLCPTTPLVAKRHGCQAMPGGRCDRPTGDADCTWSAEKAGELAISDLEGIYNWTDFCLHHGNEYILPYWDGRGDMVHMKMRMTKVLEMFQAKYPSVPVDLAEPLCDWRPPNWRQSLV